MHDEVRTREWDKTPTLSQLFSKKLKGKKIQSERINVLTTERWHSVLLIENFRTQVKRASKDFTISVNSENVEINEKEFDYLKLMKRKNQSMKNIGGKMKKYSLDDPKELQVTEKMRRASNCTMYSSDGLYQSKEGERLRKKMKKKSGLSNLIEVKDSSIIIEKEKSKEVIIEEEEEEEVENDEEEVNENQFEEGIKIEEIDELLVNKVKDMNVENQIQGIDFDDLPADFSITQNLINQLIPFQPQKMRISSISISLQSSHSNSNLTNQILANSISIHKKPRDHFDIHKLIGKGAYGKVYKATDKFTKELVALKSIPLATDHDIDDKKLSTELHILNSIQCSNVIAYRGSYLADNELWIAMEFCEVGSLGDLVLKSDLPLNEAELAAVTVQILRALAYIHEKHIIHRDVKGENVLVTSDGLIKLADFGVASFSQIKRRSIAGSPYWMAPELITGAANYDSSVDIWSLGITLIQLIEKYPPYFNLPPVRLFAILSDEDSEPPSLENSKHFSPELNDFLRDCLRRNPAERATAMQLLEHSWLNGVRNEDFVVEKYIDKALEIIKDTMQNPRRSVLLNSKPTDKRSTDIKSIRRSRIQIPNSTLRKKNCT